MRTTVNFGELAIRELREKEMGKKLGSFLMRAREDAGMSQPQLAQLMGYTSGQYVSNWERGIAPFPTSQLGKVQRLLDIKSADLLKIWLEEKRDKFNAAMEG